MSGNCSCPPFPEYAKPCNILYPVGSNPPPVQRISPMGLSSDVCPGYTMSCQDPTKQIFMIESESPGREHLFQVCAKTSCEAASLVLATTPSDYNQLSSCPCVVTTNNQQVSTSSCYYTTSSSNPVIAVTYSPTNSQ